MAEYHLLNRGYEKNGNTLVIHLANPIEEPLMLGFKTDLTVFLREKLSNSSLQVVARLQETTTQKIAYTNKEKFDAMVHQNPLLLQLKDRFGLDTDF